MPDSVTLALEAFERGQAEVAAGNRAEARRWLDRASRLVPKDQTFALALATAYVGDDDVEAAARFSVLVAANDVWEAWLGLATARWRLGDAAGAAAALGSGLQRHVAGSDITALADAIAQAAGAPGWCGLTRKGELTVRPDGAQVDAGQRVVKVTTSKGRHLLGSPIDLAAINATVGCVSAKDGGLTGWAWHPGNPDLDPVLTIRAQQGRKQLQISASDLNVRIDHSGVLGRPRGFSVPAKVLRGLRGPLHVLGDDGSDLLGSPLDPRMALPAVPVAATIPALTDPASRRRPPVDVVVPVYGGLGHTLACIDSVLASLPEPTRLIVVDDASPEPELAQALEALAKRKRIRLIRNGRNLGFAASANAGMLAAAGRDVVLLNSDTLVSKGWLDELRSVAYSAPNIGTVTPLSNDATILSYPSPGGGNALPDMRATARTAKLARRANGGAAVDVPTGVGFCMYVRRACIEAVGLLRADVFAQGYGEENDFCLRARQIGWRNVAAPGTFVAHVGGHSFGRAAQHLRERNTALLERLHPGYAQLVEAHVRTDPLAPARHRIDLLRWRARRGDGEAVLLITHREGGGVERRIEASIEQYRQRGDRVVVLRPDRTASDTRCVTVSDGTAADFPNLRYAMPDQYPALRRLLAAEKPKAIELHHLVGHDPTVLRLIEDLRIPYDVHVHDYAWFCGRVALVGASERYCGEPDVAQCDACVAEAGTLIGEDITVSALRRRSARLFAGARRIFVPSEDAAARIRRHFPGTRPRAHPHEDDTDILVSPGILPAPGRRRVCVIGAIGVHKGYQVLLDCARDAAQRQLPVEFVVVGHTIDDRRLLDTGRVFVTGGYNTDEAVGLIRSQKANLALLPSIFPETWCRTLTEAWRAGLPVAAFDIGAQAERIRRTGRGFLLPLGLSSPAINNALLAAMGLSRHE